MDVAEKDELNFERGSRHRRVSTRCLCVFGTRVLSAHRVRSAFRSANCDMANRILVGAHLSSLYSPEHIRVVTVNSSRRNIPLPPPRTESDPPTEHCLHASTFYSQETGTIYIRLLHDSTVLELLTLTNDAKPIRFLFPSPVIPAPSIGIIGSELHILALTYAGSLYRLTLPCRPPRLWSEPSIPDWQYEYHLKNPQVLSNAVVQVQDIDTVFVGLANGSLLRLTCNVSDDRECCIVLLLSPKPLMMHACPQFHGRSSQSTRPHSSPASHPSSLSITLLPPTLKSYLLHARSTKILPNTPGHCPETVPYAFGLQDVAASLPKRCLRPSLLDGKSPLFLLSVLVHLNPSFCLTLNRKSFSAPLSTLRRPTNQMSMFLRSSQHHLPPRPAVSSNSSPQTTTHLISLKALSAHRQVCTLTCGTSPSLETSSTLFGTVKACPPLKPSTFPSERPK